MKAKQVGRPTCSPCRNTRRCRVFRGISREAEAAQDAESKNKVLAYLDAADLEALRSDLNIVPEEAPFRFSDLNRGEGVTPTHRLFYLSPREEVLLKAHPMQFGRKALNSAEYVFAANGIPIYASAAAAAAVADTPPFAASVNTGVYILRPFPPLLTFTTGTIQGFPLSALVEGFNENAQIYGSPSSAGTVTSSVADFPWLGGASLSGGGARIRGSVDDLDGSSFFMNARVAKGTNVSSVRAVSVKDCEPFPLTTTAGGSQLETQPSKQYPFGGSTYYRSGAAQWQIIQVAGAGCLIQNVWSQKFLVETTAPTATQCSGQAGDSGKCKECPAYTFPSSPEADGCYCLPFMVETLARPEGDVRLWSHFLDGSALWVAERRTSFDATAPDAVKTAVVFYAHKSRRILGLTQGESPENSVLTTFESSAGILHSGGLNFVMDAVAPENVATGSCSLDGVPLLRGEASRLASEGTLGSADVLYGAMTLPAGDEGTSSRASTALANATAFATSAKKVWYNPWRSYMAPSSPPTTLEPIPQSIRVLNMGSDLDWFSAGYIYRGLGWLTFGQVCVQDQQDAVPEFLRTMYGSVIYSPQSMGFRGIPGGTDLVPLASVTTDYSMKQTGIGGKQTRTGGWLLEYETGPLNVISGYNPRTKSGYTATTTNKSAAAPLRPPSWRPGSGGPYTLTMTWGSTMSATEVFVTPDRYGSFSVDLQFEEPIGDDNFYSLTIPSQTFTFARTAESPPFPAPISIWKGNATPQKLMMNFMFPEGSPIVLPDIGIANIAVTAGNAQRIHSLPLPVNAPTPLYTSLARARTPVPALPSATDPLPQGFAPGLFMSPPEADDRRLGGGPNRKLPSRPAWNSTDSGNSNEPAPTPAPTPTPAPPITPNPPEGEAPYTFFTQETLQQALLPGAALGMLHGGGGVGAGQDMTPPTVLPPEPASQAAVPPVAPSAATGATVSAMNVILYGLSYFLPTLFAAMVSTPAYAGGGAGQVPVARGAGYVRPESSTADGGGGSQDESPPLPPGSQLKALEFMAVISGMICGVYRRTRETTMGLASTADMQEEVRDALGLSPEDMGMVSNPYNQQYGGPTIAATSGILPPFRTDTSPEPGRPQVGAETLEAPGASMAWMLRNYMGWRRASIFFKCILAVAYDMAWSYGHPEPTETDVGSAIAHVTNAVQANQPLPFPAATGLNVAPDSLPNLNDGHVPLLQDPPYALMVFQDQQADGVHPPAVAPGDLVNPVSAAGSLLPVAGASTDPAASHAPWTVWQYIFDIHMNNIPVDPVFAMAWSIVDMIQYSSWISILNEIAAAGPAGVDAFIHGPGYATAQTWLDLFANDYQGLLASVQAGQPGVMHGISSGALPGFLQGAFVEAQQDLTHWVSNAFHQTPPHPVATAGASTTPQNYPPVVGPRTIESTSLVIAFLLCLAAAINPHLTLDRGGGSSGRKLTPGATEGYIVEITDTTLAYTSVLCSSDYGISTGVALGDGYHALVTLDTSERATALTFQWNGSVLLCTSKGLHSDGGAPLALSYWAPYSDTGPQETSARYLALVAQDTVASTQWSMVSWEWTTQAAHMVGKVGLADADGKIKIENLYVDGVDSTVDALLVKDIASGGTPPASAPTFKGFSQSLPSSDKPTASSHMGKGPVIRPP